MKAIIYLRTSSAANVEGDSPYRQNDAVMAYAGRNRIEVVACYWDAAVSGADFIRAREGFTAMVEQARADGIDMLLVENATRFARDIHVQCDGLRALRDQGLRLIDASTGTDMTNPSDPMQKAMIEMAGVFAGLEKGMLVAKLKHGRDRKRAQTGRCEGRKPYSEINPDLVRHAKRLARLNPTTKRRRSLREIAAELGRLGYLNAAGKPFDAGSVANLIT